MMFTVDMIIFLQRYIPQMKTLISLDIMENIYKLIIKMDTVPFMISIKKSSALLKQKD